MSEEMNRMIWMTWLKWRSNTLPRFWKDIFFGIIILSCMYISRGTTVVIYLYNNNHIKQTLPIFQLVYPYPENHSLGRLIRLYWLLGVLLKRWFWPFFDWNLESVYPLWFCWWWDGRWLSNVLGLISWKMGKAYPN